MLECLNAWLVTVNFPTSGTVPLGDPVDYWVDDPSRFADIDELRPLVGGDETTDAQVSRRLSNGLLTDVVAAAGGVEHARESLFRHLADVRGVTNVHVTPELGASVPHGFSDQSVTAAWYEFANLLTWARAVEERVERPGRGPGASQQGLVPALQPGPLKVRVDQLRQRLRSGPLRETRLLSNFVLHAGLMRHPNAGVHVLDDGSLLLPIPDRLERPVSHVHQFTWNERRGACAFADELWAAVQAFINDLIAAFEDATPTRFRR